MSVESWSEHLRPRNAYEAVDFGFAFVRSHYSALLRLACMLIFPVALVFLLIGRDHLMWMPLVIWWLKPFWERAILFYLSRVFVGEPTTAREALAGLREYGGRDLLMALTIRRLSPTRSFDLPVTVLEGSKGRDRAARLALLHRGRLPGAATSLTILLFHVEAFLQLGLMMLIGFMVPGGPDWSTFGWLSGIDGEGSVAAGLFGFTLVIISYALVMPYYVAAGFSLYLHRRAELEAWDLELAFRRIAKRFEPRPQTVGASNPVALLVVFALVAGASLPARAAEDAIDPAQAHVMIEEILGSEAFHRPETVSIPKFIFDWKLDQESEASDSPQWLVSLAESIGAFVGGSIEILLIALALVMVLWIIWRVLGISGFISPGAVAIARRKRAPPELFGLEISEVSLPEDIVDEALRLARAPRKRDALALLYRAALARLVRDHAVDLPRGVTEGECIEIAHGLLPDAASGYFEELTGTWLRCAYGDRPPAADRLEMLCREWSDRFERPTSPADLEEGAS